MPPVGMPGDRRLFVGFLRVTKRPKLSVSIDVKDANRLAERDREFSITWLRTKCKGVRSGIDVMSPNWLAGREVKHANMAVLVAHGDLPAVFPKCDRDFDLRDWF